VKRYLLFCGANYYPMGARDYVRAYTEDEFNQMIKDGSETEEDWAEYIDLEDDTVNHITKKRKNDYY
jgi:hypothetical protein